MLHCFVKKIQKTPKRELEKAKCELVDLKARVVNMNEHKNIQEEINGAIGSNWKEVRAKLFASEEIVESDLRVALIGEIIKARQEKEISQKKLEELSGVKQPIIARMERGTTNPQLDTILKVLAPLGKTLAVVPLQAGS